MTPRPRGRRALHLVLVTAITVGGVVAAARPIVAATAPTTVSARSHEPLVRVAAPIGAVRSAISPPAPSLLAILAAATALVAAAGWWSAIGRRLALVPVRRTARTPPARGPPVPPGR